VTARKTLCQQHRPGDSVAGNGLNAGPYLAAADVSPLPAPTRRENHIIARGYAVGFGQWFFFPALAPAVTFGRAARMSDDCRGYGVFEAARELMFCSLHETDEIVLLIDLRAEVDRADHELELRMLKRFVQASAEHPWSANWHEPSGSIAGQEADLAQMAVRAASQLLGPDIPQQIRREAAGILRDLGVGLKQIGTAFSITGEAIRRELQGRPPARPLRDPLQAILDLTSRAEPARQLLRTARARYGPRTPAADRQRAVPALCAAGFPPGVIGRVFGVSALTITHDLRVGSRLLSAGGLPDAGTLIGLVRDQGPAALEAYAPAIDAETDAVGAAGWLGITRQTIYSLRHYRYADGAPGWPEGDSWTYRQLVIHRAG
jgi:hypothetical protein